MSKQGISVKNYTAKALRDIESIINIIEKSGKEKTFLFGDDLAFMKAISKKIRESVHFTLPDMGKILNNRFESLVDAELRLPFPSITLEYEVSTDEFVRPGTVHSPKRMVFACEVSPSTVDWLPSFIQKRLFSGMKNFSETFGYEAFPEGRGIFVWHACAIQDPTGQVSDDVFNPYVLGWVLPYRYGNPKEIIGLEESGKKADLPAIPGFDIVTLPTSLFKALQGQPHDQAERIRSSFINDAGQEGGACLEFIEASLCSNISHDVVQSAPKPSVSAKREKQKKLPIFEVKALSVVMPSNASSAGKTSTEGKPSRNTPRMHLRRGHIRRIPSGSRVFVRSAVIGASSSQGEIKNNYLIRANSMSKK